MPLVQITMLAGRSAEQKEALLQAVTDAVHTSIGAPVPTIRVWINELPHGHYISGGEIPRPTS